MVATFLKVNVNDFSVAFSRVFDGPRRHRDNFSCVKRNTNEDEEKT
jgi:hypothetical protein